MDNITNEEKQALREERRLLKQATGPAALRGDNHIHKKVFAAFSLVRGQKTVEEFITDEQKLGGLLEGRKT